MTDASAAELVRDLDEAIAILERAGDTQWTSWLKHDRPLIAAGDAHGLEHLLGAYGGMGSFNDFWLRDPAEGERLEVLRNDIYTKARDLLREAQRDQPQTP